MMVTCKRLPPFTTIGIAKAGKKPRFSPAS